MTWQAPSKADQEAEALTRNEDTKTQIVDETPAIIGEDATPPAAPAPAEVPAEAAAEEKREPTPFEDPRKAIADGFRRKRQEERDKYVAHTVDPQPLFLNEQAEAPVEAPPAPAAEEPKTYKVTVYGQTADLSRDQILAMADMTEEDAAGLPDTSIVKAAQITEAARRKLQAAKENPFGAPSAPSAPAAIPAAPQEPPTAQDHQAPASERPSLKDRLEKVQYGDPEEAESAFVSAIHDVIAINRRSERESAIKAETNQAIDDFNQANEDIATHEFASRFVLTESTNEIIKDLRGLGAPEANLQQALLNPAMAIQAHREALLAGLSVRKPADILAAAGNNVRQQFGLKRDAPRAQPSAAPAPVVVNDRQAAKRSLNQQPQRSGNPVASSTPAPERTRSSVIQQMRARRGQPVA